MHTSPNHAFNLPVVHIGDFPQPKPLAERAYEGLTIAGTLLLLAGILLF
jgi:hypothetical protein